MGAEMVKSSTCTVTTETLALGPVISVAPVPWSGGCRRRALKQRNLGGNIALTVFLDGITFRVES
jgi:hypothetical protein